MQRLTLAVVFSAMSVACGGPRSDAAETAPSERSTPREAASRTLEGDTGETETPGLPFPMTDASPEMQRAWVAAQEVLASSAAELPAEGSLDVVNAWATHVFAPWVTRRREELVAARELLEAVPQDRPDERLVAKALLGLLWEDFARDFTEHVALPEEIRTDPELVDVYLGALHEQSAAFRERAMELLDKCAGQARRMPQLAEWTRFCATRSADIAAWHEGPPRVPTTTSGTWRPTPEQLSTSGPRRRSEPPPPGPAECWTAGRWRAPEARDDAPRPSIAVLSFGAWDHLTAPLPESHRRRILDATRRALTDRLDIPLASEAVTARLRRAWESGRAERGGPVCARPPRWNEIVTRYDVDAARAEVRPQCNGTDCRLLVDVASPHGYRSRLIAAVEGDPTELESWMDAAQRLTVQPEERREGVVGVYTEQTTAMAARPLGALREGAADAEELRAELDEALSGIQDRVSSCSPERRDALRLDYLVSFGADGRVADLEGEPGPSPALPAGAERCVRRALRAIRLSQARAVRRALVRVSVAPSSRSPDASRYGELDGDTGVWVSYSYPDELDDVLRSRLAACYAERVQNAGPTAAWQAQVTRDRRGRVTDVAMEAIGTDLENVESPDDVASCVARALEDTRWTCPGGEDDRRFPVRVCLFRR